VPYVENALFKKWRSCSSSCQYNLPDWYHIEGRKHHFVQVLLLKHSMYEVESIFFFFSFIYKFGEFGTYVINIISSQDCPEVVIHDDPANIYLRKYNVILYHLNQLNIFFCIALLWTSLFIILMLTAWGFKCIIQQNAICCRPLSSWFSSINSSEYQEDLIVPDSTNSQGDQIIRHRIRSLDAFRGYELITLRSQLGIVTTAILCLGLQSFLWYLSTMVEVVTGFWNILLGMVSPLLMWFSHGTNPKTFTIFYFLS